MSDDITLLFINTAKHKLSIRDLETQYSTTNPSVEILAQYIVKKWDVNSWGEQAPQSTQTLRLIHMGKSLEPATELKSLRLDLSDVIHVSIKPYTNDGKISDDALSKVSTKRKANSGTVDSPDDGNTGGKCCIIV